jgi:hypothetical protein
VIALQCVFFRESLMQHEETHEGAPSRTLEKLTRAEQS